MTTQNGRGMDSHRRFLPHQHRNQCAPSPIPPAWVTLKWPLNGVSVYIRHKMPFLTEISMRYSSLLPIVAFCALLGCGGSSGGGGSDRTQVTVEKDVLYAQRSSGPLTTDVYLPVEPNGGAVILVHGGGWIRGSKEDFSGQASAFANAGYVAFTPSYRLVTDESSRYPAAIDDVQQFVRWARNESERYGFDPERLAAFGHSAGGQLVSLLGTTDTRDPSQPLARSISSRVGCVVSLSAPYDLLIESTEDLQLLIEGFVAPELREEASPLFRVDDRSAQFLLFHGTRDALIPFEQATNFNFVVNDHGTESELVPLEGEGHNIRLNASRETIQTESLRFLSDCLEL